MLASLVVSLPVVVAVTTFKADFFVGGRFIGCDLDKNYTRWYTEARPLRTSAGSCNAKQDPMMNVTVPILDPGIMRSEALAPVTATSGMSLLVGPCCDDVDCSPSSRHYPGDCGTIHDCRHLSCPDEPVDATSRLLAGFMEPGDPCKTRARPGGECSCGCTCVCVYDSGRILWL